MECCEKHQFFKLPSLLLQELEKIFKVNFSDVEICLDPALQHTGIRAMAYGRTLVFAPGQLDLGSNEGLFLLGHELAHLRQQAAGLVRSEHTGQYPEYCIDPYLEWEADLMGRKVAHSISGHFQLHRLARDTRTPIRTGEVCQFKIGDQAVEGDLVTDKWGVVYVITRKLLLEQDERIRIVYYIETKPNGYYIYKQVDANDSNYHLGGTLPVPDPVPIPAPFPIDPPEEDGEEIIEAEFPSGAPSPIISNISELEAEKDEDLFPYVYMRKWPGLHPQDRQDNFIFYNSAGGYYLSSPPGPVSLYEELLDAPTVAEAQDKAVDFINLSTQYLGNLLDPGECQKILNWYRELVALAEEEPCQNWAFFKLGQSIYRDSMIQNLIHLFPNTLEVLWQNYFALVVILGYRPDLRSCVSVLIILYNLLENIRKDPFLLLNPEKLRLLVQASLVLPAEVFPLAITKGHPSSEEKNKAPQEEWVEPYAIGELQMVKQKFSGYRLGEIARIVNIMGGEKQEITKRSLDRQHSMDGERLEDTDFHQTADTEQSFSLEEEAQQMIRSQVSYGGDKSDNGNKKGFQATYGPLTTITLNGQWTIDTQPLQQDKPSEKRAEFARSVINRSINSLSKKIARLRHTSVTHENEEKSVSLIDNSAQKWPTRAIYRWVNKIYSAWVVNYGNRFLIEFMVKHPASFYIANTYEMEGKMLSEPTPPKEIGLNTFQDILLYLPDQKTPANPVGASQPALYYAQLFARYEVKDILLPPSRQKTVSAVLNAGESQSIDLPKGYKSQTAYLTYRIPEELKGIEWEVLIGEKAFTVKYNDSNSPNEGIPLDKEYESIPVAFFRPTISSPPALEEEVYVTIVVDCVPQEHLINETQLQMYKAITVAYQQKRSEYFNQVNLQNKPQEVNNPLMNRQIQQRELIRNCIRVLFKLKSDLDAPTHKQLAPPDQQKVNRPRYQQFLEQLLEWTELTYSFDQVFHGTEPSAGKGLQPAYTSRYGEEFTAFLHAESARIIVPVRQGDELKALYFLSSGQIWDGPDDLSPIFEKDLELAFDLKKEKQVDTFPQALPEKWELTVPTVMQYLVDNDHLNNPFEEKNCSDED